MTLDSWAEQVLATAAAASNQPSNIERQLREISEKIDRIADRQSLGERASEQLAGAVQEMGASYRRARESTGQVLSEAENKTNSAVEQMTTRARELIERASKSATEFFGTFISGESTADPSEVEPSGKRTQSRSRKGAKSSGSSRGRSSSAPKKPRGSQRRRAQSKPDS